MSIQVAPQTASSQLWLVEGNFTQQWGSLERKVTGHPFNHAVSYLTCLSMFDTMCNELWRRFVLPAGIRLAYTVYQWLLLHECSFMHAIFKESAPACTTTNRAIETIFSLFFLHIPRVKYLEATMPYASYFSGVLFTYCCFLKNYHLDNQKQQS